MSDERRINWLAVAVWATNALLLAFIVYAAVWLGAHFFCAPST